MTSKYPPVVLSNKRDRDRMYRRTDWRELRRRKLRAMPLCEACRAAKATHVDHIKAHKGDESLFLDWGNLQSLCHSCHSAKTILRDGGAGQTVSDRPVPGVGADGWPIDRDHHWNKK